MITRSLSRVESSSISEAGFKAKTMKTKSIFALLLFDEQLYAAETIAP